MDVTEEIQRDERHARSAEEEDGPRAGREREVRGEGEKAPEQVAAVPEEEGERDERCGVQDSRGG